MTEAKTHVQTMGELFPERPLTEADKDALIEETGIRTVASMVSDAEGATAVLIRVDDWAEGYLWHPEAEEWRRFYEVDRPERKGEVAKVDAYRALREARRDALGISLD